VNHDVESVDRPSVSAQSGRRTLQWKDQAYAGNDHHDENVGRKLAWKSLPLRETHASHGADKIV
jgi:hypothetical protein